MSKDASELLNITHDELIYFLSEDYRRRNNMNWMNETRGDDVTDTKHNNSILTAAICLFVFSFVFCVVTVVVFIAVRKRLKKYKDEKLSHTEMVSSGCDTTSLSSAVSPTLPQIFDKPKTLDRRQESHPVGESDLKKLRVESIEVNANFYVKKNGIQVSLRRIDLDNVTSVLRENTYLYFIIALDGNDKMVESTYFESDIRPLAEENYYDVSADFVLSEDDISPTLLKVSVYVTNRYSQHQLVNEFNYNMAATIKPDDKEIQPVSLTENFRSRDNSSTQQEEKTSEILFSLCYMPTSGRLTFVAIKGKNIHPSEDDEEETYLQVSLMMYGRTIKMIQTARAKRTSNPVYNDAFTFNVSLEKIAESHLIVSVCKSGEMENSNKNILGRSVVGPTATSNEGRKHWKEMLSSPRRPVAQWHSIIE